LIVMTKQPVAGAVKTRLAAIMGAPEAAQLYEAMLVDTFALAEELPSTDLLVSFTPREARSYYNSLAPGATLVEQPEGDLGARLRHAFEEAFELGYDSAVVIGSDSPHLATVRLEEAFAATAREDACIGPCDDGGYYLLGLSRPQPALFECIDWGSDRVFDQTLAQAQSVGLILRELETEFDVDTIEDVHKLEALLRTGDLGWMPNTRLALTALDAKRAQPL
jgi:rSAM/selenodomain-associated transferase 1